VGVYTLDSDSLSRTRSTRQFAPVAYGLNINGSGAQIGATLQSTSPDFTVIAFVLLYRNQSPMGGRFGTATMIHEEGRTARPPRAFTDERG
jgi:hypothetical protein